jgi:hypothetical protein
MGRDRRAVGPGRRREAGLAGDDDQVARFEAGGGFDVEFVGDAGLTRRRSTVRLVLRRYAKIWSPSMIKARRERRRASGRVSVTSFDIDVHSGRSGPTLGKATVTLTVPVLTSTMGAMRWRKPTNSVQAGSGK